MLFKQSIFFIFKHSELGERIVTSVVFVNCKCSTIHYNKVWLLDFAQR